MRLHPDPFKQIMDNEKHFEYRLYDEKRKSIVIGDTITFENRQTGEKAPVVVTRIFTAPTFRELFHTLAQQYQEVDASDAAIEDMRKFYSQEEETRHGVIAVEFTSCAFCPPHVPHAARA